MLLENKAMIITGNQLSQLANSDNTGEKLIAAIFQADIETATKLIKNGADVNYVYQESISPCLAICLEWSQHPEIISLMPLLIQSGLDLNKQWIHNAKAVNNFYTCLAIEATANKGFIISQMLINLDADINIYVNDQIPLVLNLMLENKQGQFDWAIQLLIKNGANIQALIDDEHPYLYATQKDDQLMAQQLLKFGVDVYTKIDKNVTLMSAVLFLESQINKFTFAKILIDNGYDVNKMLPTGQTLMELCLENMDEIPELKNGAEFLKRNGAVMSTPELLEPVIEKPNQNKVEPSKPTAQKPSDDSLSDQGKIAIDSSKAGKTKPANEKTTEQKPASEETTEQKPAGKITEITPLVKAITNGRLDIATKLINNGTDINVYPNKYPLMSYIMLYAYKNKMPEILKIIPTLLEAGANVEEIYKLKGNIFNPLRVALMYTNDNLQTAKELIKHGANVNAKLGDQSLLMYFMDDSEYDYDDIISFLLDNGAR